MDHLISVSLNDSELALLDGGCRKEIQGKVDEAKRRLADRERLPNSLTTLEAAFVSDVLAEAKKSGRLTWRAVDVSHCRVCGQDGGYYLRSKTSRAGRKGTPNWSKPRYLRGIDLAATLVYMQGYPALGGCLTCVDKLKPTLVACLDGVKAEIPEGLTGQPPKWERHDLMRCSACEWEGGEHLMGKLPAVMGGYYQGECPSCHAKNTPFGPTIVKPVPGFVVVAPTKGGA